MPAEMNQSDDTKSSKDSKNESKEPKKDLIPKSFLLSGNDLQLTKSLNFKHPTVQEVIDIDSDHLGFFSETLYYSMVNIFLTDPYDYMVFLDDKGIDYEDITQFELFCLLFKDYDSKFNEFCSNIQDKEQLNEFMKSHIYFRAFQFFLGVDNFFVCKDENDNDVLAYDGNKFLMNSFMYDFVSEFVRKMNGIQETDKIHPEEQWMKEILIEDERERLKRKSKSSDDEKRNDRLGNLLSSVTWCSNGAVTPFNRNQLHMYDLYEAVHRIDKLKNYDNTMTGLCSGTVDKKGLDFNKLHWSTD